MSELLALGRLQVPIHDDLDDRNYWLDFIERCRRDFESTGNPLYAWEAWGRFWSIYRRARDGAFGQNEPLPELPPWLGQYLEDSGRRLLGHQPGRGPMRSETDPPRQREGPGSIGRALAFAKGLDVSRQKWGGQFDEREALALRVVEEMYRNGWSLRHAASEGNFGAAETTIYEAVRQARKFACRRMRDRLIAELGEAPETGSVYRAYSQLCADKGR